MDPVSQAALGSALAGQVTSQQLGRWSFVLGAVGGALADIDVAWGSLGDPALPWELHRHFTHSLPFVPFGGLVAAIPFLWLKALRGKRRQAMLAATLGYATHGLLDATTAWGTHLYWPFVDEPVGWDIVSVVDPLFTLPLLLGIALAVRRGEGKARRANSVGLVLALAYLGFGFLQHERGLDAQRQLAESRGHAIERSQVTPVIGNTVLWRSLYVHEGRVYADALRVLPGRDVELRQGTSRPLYALGDQLSERQKRVLEKFSPFAEGYLVQEESGLIGDQRFSFEVAGFRAIWGLKLSADASGDQVVWHDTPLPEGQVNDLFAGLFNGAGFEPMAE